MNKLHSVKMMWQKCKINRHRMIELDKKNRTLVIVFNGSVRYHIIEGIGKEIWLKLLERTEISALFEKLLNEHNISKTRLINDLGRFLCSLHEKGLISIEQNGIAQKLSFNGAGKKKKDTNLVYDSEIVQSYYAARNRPYKVFLEITYDCNLDCKHCYLEGGNNPDRHQKAMKLETINNLLIEMKKKGVVELIITGGEPLLNPDFINIITRASKLNFVITLLTNGILLRTKIVEIIKNLNLKEVRVSIYGTESVHDKIVGRKGAFRKTLENLKLLKQITDLGTAVTVLNKLNYNNVKELRKILSDYNIHHELSPLIWPSIYGNTAPLKLRLKREQLKDLIKYFEINIGGTSCSAGKTRFRITPGGEINPCEMLRHISFGNVKEKSFSRLLNSKTRKRWLDRFSDLHLDHYTRVKTSKCTDCNLNDYCVNCIGLSYLEKRKILGNSDYACSLAEVQRTVWG